LAAESATTRGFCGSGDVVAVGDAVVTGASVGAVVGVRDVAGASVAVGGMMVGLGGATVLVGRGSGEGEAGGTR
jgi:hypothetical protein